MDIYTKIFLINLVSLVSIVVADKILFEDFLENSLHKEKWYGLVFGIWVLLTTVSIPIWLIYIIVIWQ